MHSDTHITEKLAKEKADKEAKEEKLAKEKAEREAAARKKLQDALKKNSIDKEFDGIDKKIKEDLFNDWLKSRRKN